MVKFTHFFRDSFKKAARAGQDRSGEGRELGQIERLRGIPMPEPLHTHAEIASTVSNSRLTGIDYPDGYTVDYNYGSGLDNSIRGLTSLPDDTGTVEVFTYLGLDAAAQEASHKLTWR